MTFGTMALLNFYTVFDIKLQRVGLASKQVPSYINHYTGKKVTCASSLVTPCHTDSKFCAHDSKSSGSMDLAMLFATIMIVLTVVAVLVLICYLYRNHLWLHTRRSMGYRGMGDVSLINPEDEENNEDVDAEISTDPG